MGAGLEGGGGVSGLLMDELLGGWFISMVFPLTWPFGRTGLNLVECGGVGGVASLDGTK